MLLWVDWKSPTCLHAMIRLWGTHMQWNSTWPSYRVISMFLNYYWQKNLNTISSLQWLHVSTWNVATHDLNIKLYHLFHSQRSLRINQFYNFAISQILNFQSFSSLSAKVFKLELERRLNVMAHSSQRRLRMPSLKIKSNLQFKMWGFLNFPLSCPSLLKYEN